jgi:hypothetical protein
MLLFKWRYLVKGDLAKFMNKDVLNNYISKGELDVEKLMMKLMEVVLIM